MSQEHQTTRLYHCGITLSNPVLAKTLFSSIFQLALKTEYSIDPETTKAIFGIAAEIPVSVYQAHDDAFVEVFILSSYFRIDKNCNHICLKFESADDVLDRAAREGLRIIRQTRGDHIVLFIEDWDKNLYEIKSL